MTAKIYNVLFVCSGNSARSIMAEAILKREGAGRFRAFSAGSAPKGQIDPETVNLLTKLNFDLSDARSKSWNEFTGHDAPRMDFIFTVCDVAAAHPQPDWPGNPMVAQWGVPDPASGQGTVAERALLVADVFRMLNNRISVFANLRLGALDQLALKSRLEEIGQADRLTIA
jgi:protein-tyrosine-phosphatase